MQRLRHARHLARLALAWFALALGVAVAAPLVHPQSVQWICSGSGAVAVQVPADDGGSPPSPHALHCALCVAVAPPPPAVEAAPAPLPLAHVLQSVPAARHAARIAAPPPARGPPALSQA